MAAALLSAPFISRADAPANYYQSCEGKTEKALLQQLQSVVGPHTTVQYKSLYNVYKTSDVRSDGTLWDMYSTKRWPSNYAKCGNYSKVGDCVNREHSFPKSWFNDASPMVSDAFHVYPTDGKVNGQRSNFPYGECAHGTVLASNGNVKPLGRLGTSTFSGYSGKVFEPDDEYKGDFARTYFYMAAAYNSRISSWDSDMLAGNNYPCFTTWAVNLLLKWHRQDPVSQKVRDRNDAVEKHQHNRNPFIDYPDLAEHIWGNKKGQPWTANPVTNPEINFPVDGSSVNLRQTAVNVTSSATVNVRGAGLTADVKATVSGAGFSVSPATLSAASVLNTQGANVTVSYRSATAGRASGTLVLTSGSAKVTVNLSAEALSGLPALPATEVSDESFTANWVNISDANARYTLDVRSGNTSVAGYPLEVAAKDESHRVTGLEPETTYTYILTSGALSSNVISVTTAAPVPSVDFLYDGELTFVTEPGIPSDAAELLADIENIPGNVTVKVSAPFELSLNKQQWGTTIVLEPGADRFYLRLNGANAGEYHTSITASADGYFNDDTEIFGTIGDPKPSFVEDFEKQIPEGGSHGYGLLTYQGSACSWTSNGVYYEFAGANSYPYSGSQAARFKQSGSERYIYMNSDKTNGIGKITFYAELWPRDSKDATLSVSISSDKGANWQKLQDFTISSKEYVGHSVTVNRSGNLRVRFDVAGESRVMLDDVALTDYSSALELLTPEGHAYHTWDAYAVDGRLVIENSDPANHFHVYSLDGSEVFSGKVKAATRTIALPAGLYIVNVADFARKVLVK